MNYDYIIVGQGIVGTTLAHHLLGLNKKIMIVNNHDVQSSSLVAAGIFNPITGRRFVKTWKADTVFPYLNDYYPKVEKLLRAKFFFKIRIYRPFDSHEKQNEWMGKSTDPIFQDYIEEVLVDSKYDVAKDSLGGLLVNQSGYVDVGAYIESSRYYFEQKDAYIRGLVKPEDIGHSEKGITWNDLRADKLIFCEGPTGLKNTYFKSTAFRPVKGEILKVRLSKPIDVVLNHGVFVLPIGEGGRLCRVGATYEFNDLTLMPTEKARQVIEEKLRSLITCTYEVVDQVAGIRPASVDRRPVLGMSPKSERIGILNGFGTKGVSLAPYFSKVFVDYLESGKELDREISLKRFFK